MSQTSGGLHPACGLDLAQFKHDLVAPLVGQAGLPGDPHARINLMTGIALRESLLRYKRQIGGPALGLWQMEPATHDSLHRDYLAYRPQFRAATLACLPAGYGGVAIGHADPALIACDAYAGLCAIYRFAWSPIALPDAADAQAQARAWKDGYNTGLGAGCVDAGTVSLFEAAIAA